MPVVYVDTIDLPDSTAVDKAECLMVGIIPRSLVVGKQQDIFLTGERCHSGSMFVIDGQWLFYHNMYASRCASLYHTKMVVDRLVYDDCLRMGLIQHLAKVRIE